jgi:hypothetical protein
VSKGTESGLVNVDDPFDLNRLALAPETAESVGRAATAKRHRQQFVKFPRSWVGRLQDARHIGSYRLALYLLFQHWKSDGRPIRLSNIALVGTGVSREQKRRALWELERLGLIRVERRRYRSPLVTVLVSKGR